MQSGFSNRLTAIRLRMKVLLVVAEVILAVALTVQLVALNAGLSSALVRKNEAFVKLIALQYQDASNKMALGSNTYRTSSSPICAAMLSPGATRVGVNALTLETRLRALDIAVVVDSNAVIQLAGHTHLIGTTFDPSTEISTYINSSAKGQLSLTVMADTTFLQSLGVPEYVTNGDNALPGYSVNSVAPVRLVVTPLECRPGSAPTSFLIFGDMITRRKATMVAEGPSSSKDTFSAIIGKTPAGSWTTFASYERVVGADPPTYPDYDWSTFATDLDTALQDPGRIHSTTSVRLGTSTYTVSYMARSAATMGGQPYDQVSSPSVVLVNGSPQSLQQDIMSGAIAWHVPAGILMMIATVGATVAVVKLFIVPVEALIEASAHKQFKRFNEGLRKLKKNRPHIYLLTGIIAMTQGVLLGLVFINRHMITNAFANFSVVTSQGQSMNYIVNTKLEQMTLGIQTLGFNPAVGRAANSTDPTVVATVNALLAAQVSLRKIEVAALVDLSGVVVASALPATIGAPFGVRHIVDYVRDPPTNTTFAFIDRIPLSIMRAVANETVWRDPLAGTVVAPSTLRWSQATHGVLVRVVVSPVLYDATVPSSPVSYLVFVDALNGKGAVIENVISTFTDGYAAIYFLDPSTRTMVLTTSALQHSGSGPMLADTGIDMDVLYRGVLSDLNGSGSLVEQGNTVDGEGMSVAIVPYRKFPLATTPVRDTSDSYTMVYMVRGQAEASWQQLLATQLSVQIVIMAVEMLASVAITLLAFVPLQRFLSALDRAFNVPSMSQERMAKYENKAMEMVQAAESGTRDQSEPARSHPNTIPVISHNMTIGDTSNRTTRVDAWNEER
ncbi:CHASE domain-containing protein [Plasmodiophora brassicae]